MFHWNRFISLSPRLAISKAIALSILLQFLALPAFTQVSIYQVPEGGGILLLSSELFSEPIDRNSLTIVDGPEHGTANVPSAGHLEYLPDLGHVGFERLTVEAESASDPSVVVVVDVELRVLPRAVPIAGRFDDSGLGAPGYYDLVLQRFDLCEPWAVASEFVCLQHQVPAAGEGWLPVVGDWDGDGVELPSLFDPTTGTLHHLELESAGMMPPGQGPDLRIAHSISLLSAAWAWPVAGDWNGDGLDQLALLDADGTVRVVDNGPIGLTIETWQEPLTLPTGHAFPWPTVWRPAASTVDAIGVVDAGANEFFWLAQVDGQFQESSLTELIDLGSRIPVTERVWGYREGEQALLFFESWEFGGAVAYRLIESHDGRPETVPVKFPNDPSGP